MNYRAMTLDEKQKLRAALKEAAFWAVVVFLAVFAWNATTKP